MKGFVATKLNEFEQGKISRRRLIEILTLAATTVRATSAVITAAIDADDAIPGDNTRATLVAAPFAVRVAMIGHDDFVERALHSRRGVE